MAIGNLGLVALSEERWEDAVELLLEELRLSNRRGNRRSGAEALLGLAMAYAGLGDASLALELHGAFRRLCDAMGTDPEASGGLLNARAAPYLDRAHAQLGLETAAALTARGRLLTPEQVLERLESL